MPIFSIDSAVVIFLLGLAFSAGSILASNRWIHKCQERRLKRIESHLGIVEP